MVYDEDPMEQTIKQFFTDTLKKQKRDILTEVDKKLQKHTRLIYFTLEQTFEQKLNATKDELLKEIMRKM